MCEYLDALNQIEAILTGKKGDATLFEAPDDGKRVAIHFMRPGGSIYGRYADSDFAMPLLLGANRGGGGLLD